MASTCIAWVGMHSMGVHGIEMYCFDGHRVNGAKKTCITTSRALNGDLADLNLFFCKTKMVYEYCLPRPTLTVSHR
jgi:hypothetical protein